MKWNRIWWSIAILTCAAGDFAFAQDNKLQVQNVTVVLNDRSGRPFQGGTLETTLISAPGFESGQTIGTESVQFGVGDGKKLYPIQDGKAETKLLIQSDPSQPPFKYQFSGKDGSGNRFVSRSIDVSGQTHMITLVAPSVAAPLSTVEKVSGLLFCIITLALILATFLYKGFRRMLFNRRMEVHSAVLWSWILTLLYVLIAAATVIVAFLRPDLMSRATSTYIGLVLVFLGLYFLGFIFLFLSTRPHAVRS